MKPVQEKKAEMKIKAIRIFASLIASNIGIACCSYAGYRLGWWNDQTMWRVMFADGVYFCIGAFINTVAMLPMPS